MMEIFGATYYIDDIVETISRLIKKPATTDQVLEQIILLN